MLDWGWICPQQKTKRKKEENYEPWHYLDCFIGVSPYRCSSNLGIQHLLGLRAGRFGGIASGDYYRPRFAGPNLRPERSGIEGANRTGLCLGACVVLVAFKYS